MSDKLGNIDLKSGIGGLMDLAKSGSGLENMTDKVDTSKLKGKKMKILKKPNNCADDT